MKKHYIQQNTIKRILIAILIIGLVATNSVTLKLYIETFNVDDETVIDECADEIIRTKYFILDWYNELTSQFGMAQIYHNEIRFNRGEYTLTVAGPNIRAVYPRGERFFRLNYITYIDFYIEDNITKCKIYYLANGEIVFNIN